MNSEDKKNQDIINNLTNINQRLMAQVVELENDLEEVQEYVNKQALEHESVKEILFASEERLHNVITSAPIILYAVDDAGFVTFAEGKGIESMGFDPNQLIGSAFVDFFPELEQVKEDVAKVLAGNSFDSILDLDGLWLEIRYSPIRNLADNVVGAVCVARDITDLILAKSDRLEKEKLKGVLEMAGAVSHEFNQPLQMIMTNVELLGLFTKKPQSKTLIEAIEIAIDRMTKITQRLSTVTKYETLSYTESTNIIDIYKASR